MFLFDSETHVFQARDDISYFPLYKQFIKGIETTGRLRGLTLKGVKRDISERQEPKENQVPQKGLETVRSLQVSGDLGADALIRSMDEAGVQMACVLPESMTALSYGSRMLSTNGWLVKEVAKYPDRLIGICNVGPIKQRGVKQALWEMEYLVKEMNIKGVKYYPVDDLPINSKELWPFYEKVEELGVPLFIHTGWAWVIPGNSLYSQPILLEEVCENFPSIPIVAYHMGFPNNLDLNVCAAKYPNLYIGTSLLPRFGPGLTKNSQRLLGQALMYAGPDKIIWGTDKSGAHPGTQGGHKDEVELLEKFEISEEVQQEYGCPALTLEDKKKWAGLNLARLMKIQPKI